MSFTEALAITKDISSIIAGAGIIFTCATYLLQRRQAEALHERAEKDKAIVVVSDYAKSMSSKTSAVRKLLRELADDSIARLDRGDSFKIPRHLYDLLHAAIPDATSARVQAEEGGGDFTLSRRQSFLLRWEALSKLNAMEVVAQSWLIGIADRDTIEQQMMHLLDLEDGKNVVTTMRGIADRDCYPALHSLISKLEQRRRTSASPSRLIRG